MNEEILSERAVYYERRDAVGNVVLNRPERMNALNEDMMSDLFDCIREANADTATSVTVVSGAGPHFCAGGDLSWETELTEESSVRLMRLTGHLSYELRNAPKPTIGAVRGYCLGGGHELQLHLDLVIASESAKFGQPETRWGLLPFWYTPQLLPLVVGERRAREMLLLGRMYDADQALEMGLCNGVVPDDQLEDEVQRWADEIEANSSTAIRLARIALNGPADVLRGFANHEAMIVTTTSGNERYLEETARFFARSGSKRPKSAPARRVWSS